MDLYLLCNRLKRYSATFLLALFLLCGSAPVSNAVSRFGARIGEKKIPATWRFDDIWFYDRSKSRIIPDIDREWVAVAFRTEFNSFEVFEEEIIDESIILQKAKPIADKYNEIIDLFYDNNLAEDSCFFKLRQGLDQNDLKNLIENLNHEEAVGYAHPVIKLKGKRHAFFNAFEMKWKTNVDERLKKSLMNQAHSSLDQQENVYRVNVFEVHFLKAVDLLAEDINVLEAIPYLVELKPSIRVKLTLGIGGGNIGGKIPFSFQIHFSDHINIDPSSIANIELTPKDILRDLFEIEFDPYDYVDAVSKSPVNITGWMKFYAPGEFTIPPVEVKFTCPNKQVRTIKTKSLHPKISSILPSTQEENKLMLPMDRLSLNYNIKSYHKKAETGFFASLASFLVALIFLSWLPVLVHARREERARSEREAKKYDVLGERLKSLLRAKPSGPHWIYMRDAGYIFREFLALKYQLSQDPFGGSGKVFFESIKQKIPKELAPKIETLLEGIDNVVAIELDGYPDLDSFKAKLVELIDYPINLTSSELKDK